MDEDKKTDRRARLILGILGALFFIIGFIVVALTQSESCAYTPFVIGILCFIFRKAIPED